MVSRRDALAGQQPFVLFLISYWLLSEALDRMKSIIESVADARERFLKPGGGIIPQSADTLLLPFSADSYGTKITDTVSISTSLNLTLLRVRICVLGQGGETEMARLARMTSPSRTSGHSARTMFLSGTPKQHDL